MLMAALPVNDGAAEPAVNVMTFHKDGDGWTTIVFPRSKHRPDCYFAEEVARRVISPGALDMAGILIAARREDYENITATEAASILREVSLSEALCALVVAEIKG